MLIYGYHPVRETLRHRPEAVRKAFVAVRGGRRREEIERLCQRAGVAITHLSSSELSRRVQGVHNGFALEVSAPAESAPAGDSNLVVLLEDVQDPRNLGAILRVCDGAGVGRVLIRDRGSAGISPAVLKTSAGAAEWLAVDRIANTANALGQLKEQNFWIYGADAAGAPPWDVDFTGPVVLCLGGEEKGLRARTRGLCDGLVGLPMRGRVASLNVSAAAAALLYEAVRQRSG